MVLYAIRTDNPTATLFLSILIVLILMNKSGADRCAGFHHLDQIRCMGRRNEPPYFMETGFISWIGLMLVASHSIMAVQAFLFLPYLEIKPIHLYITAIWLFHNDVIDYVYGQYPVYGQLSQYSDHIGYFAFWLTVFVLVLLQQLVPRSNSLTND